MRQCCYTHRGSASTVATGGRAPILDDSKFDELLKTVRTFNTRPFNLIHEYEQIDYKFWYSVDGVIDL